MAAPKVPNANLVKSQTIAELVGGARTSAAIAHAAVRAYTAFETLLTIAFLAQAPELSTDKDDIAALRSLVKEEADRRLHEAEEAVERLRKAR